jgi:hypothetical protein
MAAGGGEAKVEDALRSLIGGDRERLSAEAVCQLIEAPSLRPAIPYVSVEPMPLTVFDELLSGDGAVA